MKEEMADRDYAQLLGERLRLVRRQKLLSLQLVESLSRQEFRASVLGAYERGERAISVPRLKRLASVYNVPVEQLLPQDHDCPAEEPGDCGMARRGKIVLDLQALEHAELHARETIRRFVSYIQVKRQDFSGKILTVRESDLELLAALSDTTPERLHKQLSDGGLLR